MASLKVSSSIEHICLQEWNLSASWLQGDFNAWTFTDTIILGVLLIPSLHHHLKCICLNLFHLPLSCPMFFPHLQSSLHPYLFHSTHLIFPLFLILFVLESFLLFLLEPLQAKWHITKLSPSLVDTHPRELHPEQIRIHMTTGYDLRFQQ